MAKTRELLLEAKARYSTNQLRSAVIFFFYKTSFLNGEVNYTEPSPSIRVPTETVVGCLAFWGQCYKRLVLCKILKNSENFQKCVKKIARFQKNFCENFIEKVQISLY
jgi:hypothetical protein